MTQSTNPTDDIIELTEIVEEGIPLDQTFEDFAMDKAVDSKSLDQELDDLLRDAGPQPKIRPKAEDDIDLDILFDEPALAASQPETPAAKPLSSAPGVDMAGLDDLFDSLGLGENDNGETALDMIIDAEIPQSDKPGTKTFYPSDSIDLELELPGLESGDKTTTVQNLADELLADIPEAPLLQSPESPAAEPSAPTPPAPLVQPAPEDPDEDVGILELTEEHVEEPAFAAEDASPVATDPAPPAADLEDAPQEAAPEPPLPAAHDPETVAPAPQAAQTAEAEAISHAELEIISSRLDALESRPQAAPELSSAEVLALIPSAPEDLPVALNLRREILEQVDARLAQLAAGSGLDGLQESVNALHQKVEALPDIRAELSQAASSASVQDMAAQLRELQTALADQQATIATLRQTLADKDAAIESLTAEGKALRQELAALTAQVSGAPAAEALKEELRQYVQQQVPVAAAKVIREEIQNLLKELGS